MCLKIDKLTEILIVTSLHLVFERFIINILPISLYTIIFNQLKKSAMLSLNY